MTRIIGEPVTAAALTIATFLLGSGAGSLLAQRITLRRRRAVWLAVVGITMWAIVLAVLHQQMLGWLASLPLLARELWVIIIMAPLALGMGMPMPLGLARLDHSVPQLIPWAWAVNGCASVLAPTLATLVAMSWGSSIAGGAALLMYLVAGTTFNRITTPHRP